jgi:diacylglycerol kinase (ATP)
VNDHRIASPGERPPAPAKAAGPAWAGVSPELSGRDLRFLAGRWFSLRAALAGVWYTLRTQPNAWIELGALLVVVGAAWGFGVSAVEWALLGLAIFLVLALEAVNTAVEATIDLLSPGYHPLAKIAKDTAAGALVWAVLGSIFVAAAIFGPRVFALIF